MSAPSSRGNAILQLCRFSNMPTVWSNVLVGWIFGFDGRWQSLADLPFFLIGATFLYFGGTTLNDACDAKFDRQYRPERPIPSGVFTRSQVTWIGAAWMLAGSVITLLAGASPLLLITLIALIVAYDVIHKRTRWAGVLMGLARGALVLLAGSAAPGASGILLLIWALTHTLYISGLTWYAAGESGPSARSHPIAQTLLMNAPAIAVFLSCFVVYPAVGKFIIVLILAILWELWSSPAMPIRRKPLPPPKAIPRLLAGIILIDALALSTVTPGLAIIVALTLFPLALWLQKSFAAT